MSSSRLQVLSVGALTLSMEGLFPRLESALNNLFSSYGDATKRRIDRMNLLNSLSNRGIVFLLQGKISQCYASANINLFLVALNELCVGVNTAGNHT